MQKRMNKKGAELAIGTIVMIILALVVLVVIIYGFSVGWDAFFQQITGLGGGKVNVQTIITSCQLACSTQAQFDWCKDRNVIFDEKGDARTLNCEDLGKENVGLDDCEVITCPTPPANTTTETGD